MALACATAALTEPGLELPMRPFALNVRTSSATLAECALGEAPAMSGMAALQLLGRHDQARGLLHLAHDDLPQDEVLEHVGAGVYLADELALAGEAHLRLALRRRIDDGDGF